MRGRSPACLAAVGIFVLVTLFVAYAQAEGLRSNVPAAERTGRYRPPFRPALRGDQKQTLILVAAGVVGGTFVVVTFAYIVYVLGWRRVFCNGCFGLFTDYSVPKPQLERYRHAHDGYKRPVPGTTASFPNNHKSTIQSSRDCILRTFSFPPKQPTREDPLNGVVLLCHDFGSHTQRMALLADYFASSQYHVYAIDYEGFGESQGQRGVVTDYKALLADVVQYAKSIQHGDCPLFIAGSGLGATVALSCTITEPDLFTGLLMMSPVLDIKVRPWLQHLISIVGEVVLAPLLSVKVGAYAPLDIYSRNLSVADDLAADALVYSKPMTLGTLIQLRKLTSFAIDNIRFMQTPFQIQHGLRDLLSPPSWSDAIRKYSHSVPQGKKSILWYRSAWHDLLHEAEAELVCEEAVMWADRLLRLEKLASSLD